METLKVLWGKALLIFTSIRFWQVVLGAVIGYLTAEGIISDELGKMFMTILFGSAAIGTIDKLSVK